MSERTRREPKAPAAAPAPEGAPGEASFEQSLERLTRIVEQLEEGELPLERSLDLFAEGVGLARGAQARLDRAQRRIDELLAVHETGAKTTPFATDAAPAAAARRALPAANDDDDDDDDAPLPF